MVIDPDTVTQGTFVFGAFDPATNTGVLELSDCGPNGATVGPHDNLLLGCTPANNPTNTSTLVINATTKHFPTSAASSARTRSGSTRAMGATTRAPTGIAKQRPPVRPRRTRRPCSG